MKTHPISSPWFVRSPGLTPVSPALARLALSSFRRLTVGLIAVIVVGSIPAVAWAKPYRPKNDSKVLQRLPKVLFADRGKLSKMRQQLAKDPKNVDVAAKLASDYLEIGKRENDPRFYGYARAVLEPWWKENEPPVKILRVRAKFKGRIHDFDAALVDQRLILDSRPHDVQAWLNVANLCRVLGRYEQAQQACHRLSEFANPVAIILCRAPLQAVTGHGEEAFNSLADMLKRVRGKKPALVQYIVTVQATIAQALGRSEIAQRRFQEGISNRPDSQYLLRAYGDFLLDHGQDKKVISLMRGHLSDMGILLRAALAARNLGRKNLTKKWSRQLAQRFKEIHLRGSEPNERYEARFTLGFRDTPDKALALALDNWKKQKETRDARNVLEAALAADKPAAAKPVLDFLNKHHTQNVVLDQLVQRIDLAKAQAKREAKKKAKEKESK